MHGLRVFAAILALTLSASPVLLDRCLISCEAAAGSSASSGTDGPACHRAMAVSGSHLAAPRASCGHDHLSSAAVLSAATHQVERPHAVAEPTAVAAAPDAAAFQRPHRLFSPPGASPPFAAALPLRI